MVQLGQIIHMTEQQLRQDIMQGKIWLLIESVFICGIFLTCSENVKERMKSDSRINSDLQGWSFSSSRQQLSVFNVQIGFVGRVDFFPEGDSIKKIVWNANDSSQVANQASKFNQVLPKARELMQAYHADAIDGMKRPGLLCFHLFESDETLCCTVGNNLDRECN